MHGTTTEPPFQYGAAMEIDSSSDETDAVFSTSPAFPDEISQSSSISLRNSHSTSTGLSIDSEVKLTAGRVHIQTQKDPEKSVENTACLGSQNLRHLECIQPPEFCYPKSQYDGYVHPLPVCDERFAVGDLLRELDRQKSAFAENKSGRACSPEQDFEEFELSDFVVYLAENRHHPYELWSLQDVASRNSYSTLLFDGVLRVGDVQRYVQAIPFDVCSIGNYGEDLHEVGGNIWIRSTLLAKSQIYYRLKSPAPEYARFYHSFLWLADLAKHFVDYCQSSVNEKKRVSVYNFRTEFAQWVQKRHGKSSNFQLWYNKYQSDDFRQAVAANIRFLFKECIGVDEKLRRQPIWNELLEKDAVPVQELKELKTVVTPYVYDCFKHLRFGHLLKPVEPNSPWQDNYISQRKPNELMLGTAVRRFSVEIPQSKGSNPLEGPSDMEKGISAQSINPGPLVARARKFKAIRVGDVLSVTKDGEGSVWKDETSRWKAADDCWYIYVQGVHESKKGERSFAGLWLYKSSDTCCAKMKYPFSNELFLSDNCTCSSGRISEYDVLDVVTVNWHGSPSNSRKDLFVRQTYLGNDKFETLKDEHKMCEHLRHSEACIAPEQKYPVGQTVLVPLPEIKGEHALEPFEIVDYVEEATRTMVVLKRLLRRNEMAGQGACRPNELVYSDRIHIVESKRIECTCLVRFYAEADVKAHSIPTPYDRDGTGNAFYITTRLVENGGSQELEPIHNDIPQTLLQGFNPTDTPPRKLLRGLDLYCGGGNFGRGLEEGGALHNEWAVDYAKTPMHSYYANLKYPTSTKLFCGSVDDQLYQALRGNPKKSDLIPMPGEVDFISAGSPCQGFSHLNVLKNNDKGLKNQSLVASVAAYIDFYRPKYGLLENVMTMAQKGLGRDEDVLSQLICAIVGMGYQLQLFVLDAWSFGSPQSRSRLFVSFAAPGCQPLEHPQLSHSHPEHVRSRGLGRLANGESFGERVHCPTPFEYMTSAEATKDLPDIGDGQTCQCIPYPDHVMTINASRDLRAQISAIPRYPRGSSFVSAWNEGRGVMTKAQRDLFPNLTSSGNIRHSVQKTSKAWGRVHPDKLFLTFVVTVYPGDARMGRCLHWDQQRMITVMEARRAQGFPDEEVLVGSPPEKWKVIGNSVPRTVSLALGLSLREAWLTSCPDEGNKTFPTTAKDTLAVTQSRNKTTHRVIHPSQVQQERSIPDSKEIHDAQLFLESNVGRSLNSLPLRSTAQPTSESAKAVAAPNTRLDSQETLERPQRKRQETRILPSEKSLKRPHGSLQSRILPPEKGCKTPRLTAPVSQSFARLTDPESGSSSVGRPSIQTGRHVDVPSLSKKLNVVLNQRIAECFANGELERHESDTESKIDSDEEDGDDVSISDSVVSRKLKRFLPETAIVQGRGSSSASSEAKAKDEYLIDLVSSDEDNISTASNRPSRTTILPSKKYNAVDNRKSNSFAQTNRAMDWSGLKKHG